MTTPSLLMPWTPDACTLPADERPTRVTEFDNLFTGLTSLDRVGPGHVRLQLAGASGLQETVRSLTARETQCCSFFTFTTTAVPDHSGLVTLDIEVPAAHTAVLHALALRAETIATQSKAG